MITFHPLTEESLTIALDIFNSNSEYNLLENGHPRREIEHVCELLDSETESLLVKDGEEFIGLIDFLRSNPNDQYPWLGLLMIHQDYQAKGYGRRVYERFEEELRKRGIVALRLGVMQSNKKALAFWVRLGFEYYGSKSWEGHGVECLEKNITGNT